MGFRAFLGLILAAIVWFAAYGAVAIVSLFLLFQSASSLVQHY